MAHFEFPTNIKQIGSIGDGIRIYVEDYVYTYLHQYSEAGGYSERLAILVGRHMVIDNQKILFISGALQAQGTKLEKGIMTFTEETWDKCKADIKKYFKGLEVVGWTQSQPGYGTFLNASYANYHMKSFTNQNQVLFVIDPIEKLNAFYSMDEAAQSLKEARGYFIYYDKNHNMHEYMLDHKVVLEKTKGVKEQDAPLDPDEEAVEETPLALLMSKAKRNRKTAQAERAELYHSKRAPSENRKTVNMLVSLSAVLLLISFIMGAGLIQSDGRISSLESQLTQLNTAYRDLLVQVRDNNTTAVFASQDSQVTKDNAQLINDNGNLLLAQSSEQPTQPPAQTVSTPPAATPKPTQSATMPPAPQTPKPVQTVTPTQNANLSFNNVPDTYTVEEGDSLGYISFKFYGTYNMVEKIMEVNGLSNADTIFFGKVLKLPK